MFEAYFDASRSQAPGDWNPIFALAGYIASAERWEGFEKDWRDALASKKIETFHMTDCLAQQEEFESWTLEAALAFTADLVEIVNRWVLFGCAAVMPPKPFFGDDPSVPYRLCLQECLRTILVSYRVPLGEEIAIFVEQENGVKGRLCDHLAALKVEQPNWGWSQFSDIAFVPKKLPPLQAADLLAYEHMQRVHIRGSNRGFAGEKLGDVHSYVWEKFLFDTFAMALRVGRLPSW